VIQRGRRTDGQIISRVPAVAWLAGTKMASKNAAPKNCFRERIQFVSGGPLLPAKNFSLRKSEIVH
jgi:hypothetical protein